jgi:hypothetical protein
MRLKVAVFGEFQQSFHGVDGLASLSGLLDDPFAA